MSGLWRGWISLEGGNGLYTGSFSLWNGDSGLIDDNPGETPPDAITTPLLADAADPNLPGDWRPVYEIDFVDPYPTGGGIGDILQGRWGDSEAEAELMTPEEATISESWWIDGVEPFPALGDFGGSQPLGTDVTYQVRIRRGSLYSAWSAFKTLEIVDGVMTAPGWTDLTNQTASTRVWSSGVTVAGMATGAYARLLGTGPLKVGSTEYEAGTEVLVQNGDTLYAGVDTSATGGATVNNVVTNRGAALETFSATTVGSSADASAGAAPNAYNVGYGSDYHEFTGVSMTAGDNLIFVFGGFNYGSCTVKIDGVSINSDYIDASQSGVNRIEAYRTNIAADDDVTIRVEIASSALEKVGIAIVNLTNCGTVASSAYDKAFGYSNTPISLGSPTIPTDGIGVFIGVSLDGSGGVNWTNATEIGEKTTGAIMYSIAKVQATAAVSYTDGWAYTANGGFGIVFNSAVANEDYLLITDIETEASATPSTVAMTIDDAATGFRVWSGHAAALGEEEWLLYVKKNSDPVFAVAMERYWGRILHAEPGDTFAFGTSDGRTLQMAQMVVPGSLIVPSGATGTANCDEALPLIWEPTAPHITLPGNGSAFQIDADGTERWVFIAERDADNVWSPPRVVRISDTRDTIIQCNFAEIALANEAGETLDITAPTGSTIGGTKGVMSLDTIPAVTGTTHNVSTVAQFKTAIAAAVSGDAIAAASGTYAFDVAITDASFTANEGLGNQGAEGILIYGTTGDRDDVVLTGNGTSTNGSWTLTQGGASAFTTFKDLTFDFATYGIKFTASGGKFNFDNVLGKGGTGTDIFSFNNTAGALTVKALHTQLQDGAGDLWNFDGDATYNAASLVDMIGCSGLRPGPSNNSYQCATTHHDLPIRVHGGLWSDAHLNVFANGNATSITYAEFATITKGARTSGIANTHLYCCDWEVNPATTGNSTLLAAIGNHVTGAKDATSYGTFRNCPIVERNVIAVTSGRGIHNSIQANGRGNIIVGADTAIRNGDAVSLMGESNFNFNTLVGNTTGLNHPTTTNDPAVFSSNAAKSNTTSVNTTAGAKTSLTGDYNVLDSTVDADYVVGAHDTTGADAALDSYYFPTASGNCDDNGDYSKLGFVGSGDPWGFVFAYKQNVVPRGARSLPIIRSGAELYPDVY